MAERDKIIRIIKKYKLQPATTREFPLTSLSVIFLAYTNLLKREIGFRYDSWAALGKKNIFHTFVSEDEIRTKTKAYLEKNKKNLKKLFNRTNKKFNIVKKMLEKAKKISHSDPEKTLKLITELYPLEMVCIGVYNCFWRYVGNSKANLLLSKKEMDYILKKRDEIAKVYPKIEEILKISAEKIGKKYGFDGDLLRYMSLEELKKYLKDKKLQDEMKKTLEKRRQGYFYIFAENKEHILTDKKLLKKIRKTFFWKKIKKIRELKGIAAFRGKARGFVFNLSTRSNTTEKHFVLVTHMTKPGETILLGKCSAIVTDEGGLLSHAAIVSRELKKPCIIGTKIATKVLKTGDYVEVDANKGIVRIIKKA